ncbi:3-deoxy-manno-octulosonate cytidylyltransferase [Cytobacillus horneckiae]|uniref:3-deoxy-manno-octulosonate cytidylyltransferase n=1 Tax=Cytobacillus horneckiae TaxID=549687 RepID=UPI0030B7F83F
MIPARYGSTRFPGKPLALINGKPMIEHVYRRVMQSEELEQVVIATDDERIKKAAEKFGAMAVMTRSDHMSGSDRISEVSKIVEGDFFVNIQGDEPLISPLLIDELVREARMTNNDIAITAMTEIVNKEEVDDPNIVKVVTDQLGYALFFSRKGIPYNRTEKDAAYYKHIGLYGFPRAVLHGFVDLPPSQYEKIEMLEQLRLLENGYRIKMIKTDYDAVGVDTPEDIEKVESIIGGKQYV